MNPDNFVTLPKGSFLMGSLKNPKEQPLHQVTIAYDIAISKRLVTVEEYRLFAQATGAEVPMDKHTHLGVDVPVRRVRWSDAVAYCAWKTQREGRKYRLPTEAEWEYACRAGTSTEYSFGDEIEKLGDYAWYSQNSHRVTHDVATKKPNAWGIYDMHGNLWEWCSDRYSPDYSQTPTDGSAYTLPNELGRVLRGGSWNGSAESLRCANRINLGSGGRNYFVGFRVVIEG